MIKKISAFILVLCMATGILLGCSNKKAQETNAETPYYTLDIDGNKIYLQEDLPKVASVKKAATDFIILRQNKDYKNFDAQGEYKYFSKDTYNSYMDAKNYEIVEEFYKESQLTVQYDSADITNVKFFTENDVEKCKVTMVYKDKIISATNEYLEEVKAQLNVPYEREAGISMVLENNEWKIVDWNLTERKEI